MDFLLYIVFVAVYVLTIHFALAVKDGFNLYLMVTLFALGGFIGYWYSSYEMGFVVGVVLSLLFW